MFFLLRQTICENWLVLWNINVIFHSVGNNDLQLTFIFFRGVGIPATSIDR
jgi:hypothetical protein